MKVIRYKRIFLPLLAFIAVTFVFTACDDTVSYSELLRYEQQAVNHYLAGQKVSLELPADSISFETGPDAPFYKLDQDGYVYMQVIKKGNPDNRVNKGDKVYFRYNQLNLKLLYADGTRLEEGNQDFVASSACYFMYGNTYLSSTTQWGTGIQLPLRFFGYDCEVNLVLQSYYGFNTDQTACVPYLINLKYFQPEY